jgi:rhodanese-related sulfurtransferase
MKNIYVAILFIIGVVFLGCNEKEKIQDVKVAEPTHVISGKVQGGYRTLTVKLIGEHLDLTVYRGDYIKFILDDDGAVEDAYQLEIPDLGMSANLKDDTEDRPYFKMKVIGQYQITIGERSGTIEVVELTQANYTELSNEEAYELLDKEERPFLLDVRTRGEFNRGYIDGAVLISLQEIQRRVNELEMYKNQPILIYCATGNRSTTASKILLDNGFKNVMNLRRGIVGWARNGYATKL